MTRHESRGAQGEANATTPEAGQASCGKPRGGYEMPDYARALLLNLLDEIDRVYWNREQDQWEPGEDPRIPGIVYRPFWWGKEDAPEAKLPNFEFEGVELRWYQHPGRGMSANRDMTPAEWCAWYSRCLAIIEAHDEEGRNSTG